MEDNLGEKRRSMKARCFVVGRIESQNFDLTKQMRLHRRSRHEIIADILETAKEGVIRARIMDKAKLSSTQFDDYLQFLVERGFLENFPIPRKGRMMFVWKTTKKGTRFLEIFRILES